jgi:nitronate monooxygenase
MGTTPSLRHADPVLIQGGMGVAVSSWRLARAVSSLGHLGVVSGTALDVVLARRLQLGDPDGEIRRAMANFPNPSVARDVLGRHFIPGGKPDREPYSNLPMFATRPARQLQALAALAGFVEVFLAKDGHEGPVGINFLEKVQLPTPAILYGALLAGVDYVLVGAGIPRDVPMLLDRLVAHEPATLPVHVTGASAADRFVFGFDPSSVVETASCPPLRRPRFLAIVSSATLAVNLARHSGRIDGFVVEGPTAGGHNAPPRGPLALSDAGEPIYGPRDTVDLERIRDLGLPFWLAGSRATPGDLIDAQRQGASGIQVGTLFAFCDESGVEPSLRTRVLEKVRGGAALVHTDPLASPTGFPFKVVQVEGTLSEAATFAGRERRCDLGYLREIYRRGDGTAGYRCPAEPIDDYVRKGGRVEDTVGRKCICNGLLATVGLGQRRRGAAEPPIVTAGTGLLDVGRFLRDATTYSAAAVVSYLTGPVSGR